MKKIIVLILLAFGLNASVKAQVRGTFGTYQATTASTASIKNAAGTVVSNDTLKGADTSSVNWTFSTRYAVTFAVTLNTVTDSITATSYLQCSSNGTTWQSVTGKTSSCTTCIGASKSTTDAYGSNTYSWCVDPDDVGKFQYWRIITYSTANSAQRTKVTGTAYYSF